MPICEQVDRNFDTVLVQRYDTLVSGMQICCLRSALHVMPLGYQHEILVKIQLIRCCCGSLQQLQAQFLRHRLAGQRTQVSTNLHCFFQDHAYLLEDHSLPLESSLQQLCKTFSGVVTEQL